MRNTLITWNKKEKEMFPVNLGYRSVVLDDGFQRAVAAE